MILVTGGTGFIGSRLVDLLSNYAGLPVRILLKPGSEASNLPKNTGVSIVVGDLMSEEALRVATLGVDTVIHLASTGSRGRHSKLHEIDLPGTKKLLNAAMKNHVGRVITVSRVGADRQSAFDILRIQGEIEEAIITSGLAYTILRSSVVFGENDHFSENLAMLLSISPIYALPEDGSMTLQPIWVEDLVACIMMALENHTLIDKVISLGGPEILTFKRIILRILHAMKKRRILIDLPIFLHKRFAWYFDGLFLRWPYSENFVDIITSKQTADLGLIERKFNFRPASFDLAILQRYLKNGKHAVRLLKYATTIDSWE